ncbi:MAG: hypothetical protein ACRDF4_11915 [Rhabdochlamydiaceae bacterium]
MAHLKRILKATALGIIAMPWVFGAVAHAQVPNYGGALLYSELTDTSVPPLYSGQPTNVATAYLWLDDAMRLYPGYEIDSFINAMTWSDTAKTIASALYQIQDDNPLSYYNWDDAGIYPHPYKGDPGHAEFAFIKRAWSRLAGTTVGVLLNSEIIADVMVTDTFCKKDPAANIARDAVLVNATILDEIKGKWVPTCPNIYRAGKKGALPLSDTIIPTPVLPDTAAAGTCLQFEYSPEWPLRPAAENPLDKGLKDSTGGWWIKPGKEYIVFLYFNGVGYDNTHGYFTTFPVSFGYSGGMYPVVNGIVQDPHDDFRFGATGLSAAQWKAALRNKINALVNP